MNTIIKVEDLKFRYSADGPYVLKGVNLEIARETITGIVGLSGCGKSTLAMALNGAIPQRIPGLMEGRVQIDGHDTRKIPLSKLALKVGLVYQDPDNQLFLPTVEDEIAFGPENICLPREHISERVETILKALKIENLRHKNPSHLSGGQKHLVALAAVLSLNPDVIILDEPTAELDEENTRMVLQTIKSLKNSGKTIIIIEHNLKNLSMADSILVMADGRIVECLEGEKDYELLSGRIHELFLPRVAASF
jgi:energy-coupling factor transport system ATP-binding protein